MAEFYRGSTPTLRFYPQNGLRVENLGNPIVTISQEYTMLTFENDVEGEEDRVAIVPAGNFISVTLTEAESRELVDGVDTQVQVTWYIEDEEAVVPEGEDPVIKEVLKFPTHSVTVLPSLMESVIPDEEEEPPDDIFIDDVDTLPTEDPEGILVTDSVSGEEFYLPDYMEYYGETGESEPLDAYLYTEGVVEPVPDGWEPGQ